MDNPKCGVLVVSQDKYNNLDITEGRFIVVPAVIENEDLWMEQAQREIDLTESLPAGTCLLSPR